MRRVEEEAGILTGPYQNSSGKQGGVINLALPPAN